MQDDPQRWVYGWRRFVLDAGLLVYPAIVGVNAFTEGNQDDEVDLLRIDNTVEDVQLKRLAQVKHDRDDEAVAASLRRIADEAADPTVNLMPAFIAAVRVYATEEEIVNAMRPVFGTYVETTAV